MTPMDELREAASRLRKLVAGLPASATPPWRQVDTDSESPSGLSICGDHLLGDQDACDSCWTIETWNERLASYLVPMHPGMALELAGLLDVVADIWRPDSETKHHPQRRAVQDRALAVARAYLGAAKGTTK